MKAKLNARNVQTMKPLAGPDGSPVRTQVFDTEQRGLALRIAVTGTKTWSVVYKRNGRMARYTIGAYPDVSLAKARQRARTVLRDVADGADPQAAKKADRRAKTFEELATEYMVRWARKRKKSWKEDQRIIDSYLLPRFRHVRAKDLTRADVRVMLDAIAEHAPIQANRVLACIRKIYNWALSQDLIDVNPCLRIERLGRERQRDRVLTDTEIRAVWEASELEKLPTAAYVKLLLLTLKREGETSTMRWSDLDLDQKIWTIPAEATKTQQPDLVPLSKAVCRILEKLRKDAESAAKKHDREASPFVFPNRRHRLEPTREVQKLIQRIRDNAKIDGKKIRHWTGHDLRRTGRSYMGRLKVPGHISELLLGHKRPGIVSTYDHYDYVDEKREALEKWSRHVTRVVSGLKVAQEHA